MVALFSGHQRADAADCVWDKDKWATDIIAQIDGCLETNDRTKLLVDTGDAKDASLTGAGRERIKQFLNRLISLGLLLSVTGLVIGGGYMAASIGDEAKIKKWKDAVKWSIIGTIVLILGYPAVNAIINLAYELGK